MNDEFQPSLLPGTPSNAPVETERLEAELESLRGVVFRVVVGLLILAVAVNVFLWRQVHMVRAQLAAGQKQVAEYQKAEPAVRDLLARLHAFAATHPDFQPIMSKYAGAPTNAPAKR